MAQQVPTAFLRTPTRALHRFAFGPAFLVVLCVVKSASAPLAPMLGINDIVSRAFEPASLDIDAVHHHRVIARERRLWGDLLRFREEST